MSEKTSKQPITFYPNQSTLDELDRLSTRYSAEFGLELNRSQVICAAIHEAYTITETESADDD
jgi:hypothetical protein